MKLNAYAKLNLTLDITGLREDGYHLLSSVMQEVSLCDELEVLTAKAPPKIQVKVRGMELSERDNTCYKAAEAFLTAFGIRDTAVKIIVQKNIPAGAGLGGGSSDAAAVLKALNALCGIHASDTELERIGLSIGADVPFFIRGGTQQAQGIGEVLTPLSCFGNPYFVLVKPADSALTCGVYSEFDRMVADGRITEAAYTTKKFMDALQNGGDPYEYIGNMLQPVTEASYRIVRIYCDTLRALGARCACMTGSGTAVFGLFDSYANALEALKKFDLDAQAKYICVAQNCK